MTVPSLSTNSLRNALVPLFAALEEAHALLGTQDLHSTSRAILNGGNEAKRALMRLIEAAEKESREAIAFFDLHGKDYRAQAANDFAREYPTISALAKQISVAESMARDEHRTGRTPE